MKNTRVWIMQALAVLLASAGHNALAETPDARPLTVLGEIDASPHIVQMTLTHQDVVDHQIGLGAMEKVSGIWRIKSSERRSGHMTSYTWQVIDGFSAEEVLTTLENAIGSWEQSSLLFGCDGRACGHPTQWANRVFHERLLYGRVDLQRYRVYALEGKRPGRLILYSASRSADRQYLQAQWLEMVAEEEAEQAFDSVEALEAP